MLRNSLTFSEDSESENCITLKEINTLDKLFKDYYFKLTWCENGDKYSNWNIMPFRFSKILADEEKENIICK
jgi:hypothetical protein